ncbi:unnamed protein product [Staurois parvus]|uniref:Uncharacterized protein n=1 Tax=Staurois parvus TaxID=386267 RepID=A0ABN9EN07_9NEOB|nr:unnamed protein product [Staurois parvus]
MSLVKITQIRIYFLVRRKVIEFTNYGIYMQKIKTNCSGTELGMVHTLCV